MSKQMLELADEIEATQPNLCENRVEIVVDVEERGLIIAALRRCSADSADETRIPLADHDEIGRKVLNQPWAIQSAVVTIAAHCTVIKNKCEDGDLNAASDLAGCISNDLLELASFLAGTEPQTAPPVRADLPAQHEIRELITSFEKPDDDTQRAFASHRRTWIVQCLQAVLVKRSQAACSAEDLKRAFAAGYWLWFGPANKRELDDGMAEIEKGWTEYLAALTRPQCGATE